MSSYFSLGDAARAIGLEWEHVLALVRRGVIPGHRHHDGTWALDADAVLQYARQQAQKGAKNGN